MGSDRQTFLIAACIFWLAGCAPNILANREISARASSQVTAANNSLQEAEETRLAALRAQFAQVEMHPDTSFLTDEERSVINTLNKVGDLMSEIYLRQRSESNPALRNQLEASGQPHRDLLLDLFDLHFGPWDTLNNNTPFYGETEMPAGAAFYPADMTRNEFEAWITAHPQDETAFRSRYSVIRRNDTGGLVAIPYSTHYREWLEPAAALMREAALITKDERLKRFLTLRADAFLSNDYFASELAWMDVDGPIESAIGPYAVYTDRLLGYKTAFVSFITIKNPAETAALAKYKTLLRDMELNLPVDDRYKNTDRVFESPIAVAYQVHGGGNNVPGPQALAFNLPDDENVRKLNGAKKVILNNVLQVKFERIIAPIADIALVPEQAHLVEQKHIASEILFHELSHSLGPEIIMVDGEETTVNVQLKDLFSAIEEGKSEVMGAYNVLYMMHKGALPKGEKHAFLATYFAGLFRPMRFGIEAAHAKAAAYQYGYFKQAGTFSVEGGKLRLDFPKLETAIRDLTRELVMLQGDGDYRRAKAFLEHYARLDNTADNIISDMSSLPVDIEPIYPDEI